MDESIFIHDSLVRRKMWTADRIRPIVTMTGSHQKTSVFGTLSMNGRQLFRQYDFFNQYTFLHYCWLLLTWTLIVQLSILSILLGVILETLIYHQYNVLSLLLVVYLSHFFSAGLLVVLSLTFLHWFKITRSFSMIIYAIVFIVAVSLFMLAIPLLTEQYMNQPPLIYPRSYESLVDSLSSPTRDIAFIYGFIDYVLPVMIICSWILTASLLKGSAKKIGKLKFWVIVSIPLLYQFITYVVKNTNLITDPSLVQIVYSNQFQIFIGISYQISGLFFAVAFLAIARKTQYRPPQPTLPIS